MGGSPGLVDVGGDSCSECRGFESRHRIHNPSSSSSFWLNSRWLDSNPGSLVRKPTGLLTKDFTWIVGIESPWSLALALFCWNCASHVRDVTQKTTHRNVTASRRDVDILNLFIAPENRFKYFKLICKFWQWVLKHIYTLNLCLGKTLDPLWHLNCSLVKV